MSYDYAPGAIVRLPAEPDWGEGMVQSAIGNRVTVNFQHAGKRTLDVDVVALQIVSEDDRE